MSGKRASDEEFDWNQIPIKKIGIILLIIVVIVAAIILALYIVNNQERAEKTNTNTVTEENKEENKMLEQIDGYNVLGKLIIEKIEFEQYIVDSTENAAMEKYPVKLYGKDLNKEGNFCIAGHNYEEIFKRLNELAIDDEFYIEDKDGIIQDYVIKEITEVEPTDLNCLRPVSDKIQVTLITCVEGATKRLVIRAERIDIEV